MTEVVKPMQVKQKLHGNPKNQLQFSVKVKNYLNEEVPLACPQATRAMVSIMDMEAVLGGAASHFGGPSAFAEMMSALFGYIFYESGKKSKQWHELFHFVNDAGHCENGLYALKANYKIAGLDINSLKKFRSIESQLTGHGEAHLFPEGVYISNGPLGSGLPQAQGLAIAEKLSGQNRTTVVAISDGGCMEGEAKESFAAIPGFFLKGKSAPVIVMISDNNTKLSGRIDGDSFSMKPTFESLSALGWEVTFVEDGHNLQTLYSQIEKSTVAAQKKPQVLWVKTIKGKGVKSAEQSSTGAHGFPLDKPEQLMPFLEEIYSPQEVPAVFKTWSEEIASRQKAKTITGAPVISIKKEKIQTGVSSAMVEAVKRGLPVVSISSDLQGSTGVAGFRKAYPQNSLEVGIAEANMVSTGIGLSKQGFIPVVDTFAQFAVTKGALPLIMSGLSEGPVIGVFSHTGFQDAADGASHQALAYIGMVASIPHVEVYCLTSSSEAHSLLLQAFEKHSADIKVGKVPPSRLFFLGRENFLERYTDKEYKLGKAQILTQIEGKNSVVIAAAGSMIPQALKAQELLHSQGVGSLVINPSIINNPDIETFKSALDFSDGRLITLDDHSLVGGMGSILIHTLINSGINIKARSLGVKNHFGRSAYKADELYKWAGISEKDVVSSYSELV